MDILHPMHGSASSKDVGKKQTNPSLPLEMRKLGQNCITHSTLQWRQSIINLGPLGPSFPRINSCMLAGKKGVPLLENRTNFSHLRK